MAEGRVIDFLFGTDLNERYNKRNAMKAMEQLEKERQGAQQIDEAMGRTKLWAESLTPEQRQKVSPESMVLPTKFEGLGDLGNFSFQDRARELGLTGKYSHIPEVQNYLAEPNKTKMTEQQIQSKDYELGENLFNKNLRDNSLKALTSFNADLQAGLNPREAALKNNLPGLMKDEGVQQSVSAFMTNPENKAFQTSEREASQTYQSGENEKNRANSRYIADANLSNSRAQNAALRAAEFDVKEKDMLSAVDEGKFLLYNLVDTFKNSGFGGVGSAIGEATAKIPLVGKYAAGKNKEYQNQKRLAAETWLRAATGAAAPKHEVDTYTGFLPSESDPPEVADKKIQNFFNKIAAKAEARTKIFDVEGKALEQRGMVDLANTKYTQANLIRQMIQDARKGIPTISPTENYKFNSIEEAEAAKLPKGTVIYVNGRRAVVE